MANTEKATAIEIIGVQKLLKALSKIDKELQKDVRDASGAIADDLVSGARQAAHTPVQVLAASGLKVRRDRVPVVASGKGKVGHRSTPIPAIFYGAEFGGQRRPTTLQFASHKGRDGYFLYPTARARGKRYADMWGDAIDKAFKAWDDKSAKGMTNG